MEKKDAVFWDRDLAGFGVRVHTTGRKVYVVQSRGPGGLRRLSLGHHGDLFPQEARKQAQAVIDRIKRGMDPIPAPLAPEFTVAGLAERYLRLHVSAHCKPNSARLYRLELERHVLPALGAKPIGAVKRQDVAEFHHRLRNTPYTANRAVKLLSRMFRQAERWELMPPGSSPCRSVRLYTEQSRDRFLTPEEYRRLGLAEPPLHRGHARQAAGGAGGPEEGGGHRRAQRLGTLTAGAPCPENPSPFNLPTQTPPTSNPGTAARRTQSRARIKSTDKLRIR